MKKNKLLKIMISSVVSIMLFTNTAFTVFAADSSSEPIPPAPLNSNGSWDHEKTTTEEGTTTTDPNLGKSKDFGANNIDPTVTENNRVDNMWKEIEEKAEKVVAAIFGTSNPGSSGGDSRITTGSGYSYDDPFTMYYGDGGDQYRSRFKAFCDSTENGSCILANGRDSRSSYQDYDGEDEDGNPIFITFYERSLFATVTATKSTSEEHVSEHRDIDYWVWRVEFALEENSPHSVICDTTTATSSFSYIPTQVGHYIVTSIPHQHITWSHWKDYSSNAIAKFGNGREITVLTDSGTTPVNYTYGEELRDDKAKVETFKIAPPEVNEPIIKDFWQWREVKIDKSEAEYETELIN